MAKTIEQLKAQSTEVKNATVVGENTATRVGTLFTDIVEHVEKYEAEQAQAIIFDVSARNNGIVFESISALLNNSNLSTLIPTSVRHGGMSIRFIQGSEQSSDNKYVQYRLMSNTFNTTVANWQGVEDEPTAGSDNLVKSGGIVKSFKRVDLVIDSTYYGILSIITDFEVQSAVLKQYYNRDRTSLPEQSSQVLRIDFTTIEGTISFLYTYEGGPQLTSVQELTKVVSGHSIIIRVDWQLINDAPEKPIAAERIININIGNIAALYKANSFIFKDSSVPTDFGFKSIYTDFEFSSIRLSQYYNRDRTSTPEQSSQVIVFYVMIDGTEQRFVYTFEGGSQLTSNQDIELVNNGKHIYVNLDWKAINQEFNNYYLLKGNIQQLYKLPTEVIKESDFSLVSGINIADPNNIIEKAVIDVRSGILYTGADRHDGSYVLSIAVASGQVISFGHFTLGKPGGYTFYNSSTPTGNFGTFQDPQGGKATTVTVPLDANILYIQVHTNEYPSADYSEVMANYGNNLANYEPFGEEIELIKGYKIKGIGETKGQFLSQLVVDLPISDGTDIQSGYAYIDSSTRNVKVKE